MRDRNERTIVERVTLCERRRRRDVAHRDQIMDAGGMRERLAHEVAGDFRITGMQKRQQQASGGDSHRQEHADEDAPDYQGEARRFR